MSASDPLPIKKPLAWGIRILFWACLAVFLYFAILSVGGLIHRPHRPEATLAICTELEQAVQRFYDDNGTLPVEITEDSTFALDSPLGIEMLRVLQNNEASGPKPLLNVKGIKYANFKQASGHKIGEFRNGLAYDKYGTQVIGLYDSWGRPIMICLDGDFDEEIAVKPKAQKESRTIQRRVAVWSDGKDPEDPKDDVTTW